MMKSDKYRIPPSSGWKSKHWFFGTVSRTEANDLLSHESNPCGSFLVRRSQTEINDYVLSVKNCKHRETFFDHSDVKHHLIKKSYKGRYSLRMATNRSFYSLQELLVDHSEYPSFLCQILSRPCSKPKKLVCDIKDKYEIPRSKINIYHKIGEGSFGQVHYGTWKNQKVAVKVLREGTMSIEDILQEADIMKKCRHERLVEFYAVCSEKQPILIVQEYMSKGSLLSFLKREKHLDFDSLRYIASQIASGMEYLESKKLIHRDLAARNVLIDENNDAKICDFGLARFIHDGKYWTNPNSIFPIKWTAPEALKHGKFSIKSDVWSYGILLIELFTYGRYTPYSGMTNSDVIEKVLAGYRMPKPKDYYFPDHIYDIILECWDADPNNRPTFEYLKIFFE